MKISHLKLKYIQIRLTDESGKANPLFERAQNSGLEMSFCELRLVSLLELKEEIEN